MTPQLSHPFGMSRVRVAVIGHTAVLGGGELNLERLLAAVDQQRFETVVVLFAEGPLVERLRQAGQRVVVVALADRVATADRGATARLNGSAIMSAAAIAPFEFRLLRTLRKLKVNAIHANTLKAFILTAPIAGLLRRRLVWSVHDRISPDYLPTPTVAALRWAARHVPFELIANSAATLTTLHLSAAGPRSTVAYPGLAEDAFVGEGETPASFRVGIVGRISPTKGQDVFLRAAAVVHSRFPHARFRVIGSALFNEQDYERQIHTLAADLGLLESTEFTGFVKDPRQAFDGLAVAVHASAVPEPFGMVVTEAMAARVPVVATAAGGVLEILDGEPREFGLLVEPGNHDALAEAICWIFANRQQATEMADRAQSRAWQQFRIADSAERIMAVWARAAER